MVVGTAEYSLGKPPIMQIENLPAPGCSWQSSFRMTSMVATSWKNAIIRLDDPF